MYILVFYVPDTHLESVKEALFAKGAGAFDGYSKCSFESRGEGQFMPGEGADPFLGRIGTVERVSEFRVEMVCPDESVKDIGEELLRVHPYEVPAYHFIRAVDLEDLQNSP